MSLAHAERPDPGTRRPRLGALRHRNYRLYFTGQAVSTIGTWMQSIAQPWLVLQLTHNAFLVGLVTAAQFLPMMLLGPFGGVVADRFPKRSVLVVTQILFMVPALALFQLSHSGAAQFWMVVAAALFFGTVQVFDTPARQAFVMEMVGRQDLMNAIALNSSVWNGAAVIGPSLAGILIAVAGVPVCFAVNALSYLGAIASLAMMRDLPAVIGQGGQQSMLARIREGAAYARHDPLVLTMLTTVAIFSLFAMNRLTLIPLFADQVLHAGPTGFGFLMGATGLGALTGALLLALVMGPSSGRRQFGVAVAWVFALLAFSFSRALAISMALLFIAGFCQIWFLATANSRIQTATPDHLRGRVMALYAQALMGVGPVGALQAGGLASLFGAPVAMASGAIVAGLTLVGVRFWQPAAFRGGRPE